MRITRREKKFWEQHLSCVRHITLDPKGPGVVRLHMIPPRAEGKDEPFLLLLNGAKLIPLNLSWAILLANFMAALESFFTESDNAPDREVEQADWERLAEEAVTATRSVYPRTKPEQLRVPVYARDVIWACGGIGGIYDNSTNFPHLTGDALAIAIHRNVALKNVNYVQIHPTTLYSQKKGRRFLISESVRGEGAVLLDKNGERFTDELQPTNMASTYFSTPKPS